MPIRCFDPCRPSMEGRSREGRTRRGVTSAAICAWESGSVPSPRSSRRSPALMLADLTLVTDMPEVLGVPAAELEAWRPSPPAAYRPGTRLVYVGSLGARLDLPGKYAAVCTCCKVRAQTPVSHRCRLFNVWRKRCPPNRLCSCGLREYPSQNPSCSPSIRASHVGVVCDLRQVAVPPSRWLTVGRQVCDPELQRRLRAAGKRSAAVECRPSSTGPRPAADFRTLMKRTIKFQGNTIFASDRLTPLILLSSTSACQHA